MSKKKQRWAVHFENKGTWASHHHVNLYQSRNCSYKGIMVLEGDKEDAIHSAKVIISRNFPNGDEVEITKVVKTKRPVYVSY